MARKPPSRPASSEAIIAAASAVSVPASVAKSAAAKAPVAKPVAKPILATPAVAKPVVAKPVAAKPVAAKPVAAKPALVEPAVVAPVMAAPVMAAAAPLASAEVVAPGDVMDAAKEQIDTMREMVRQTSEATLEQSRALYARLKQAAEEATGSLETACDVANKGVAEINLKAIETMKANADAAFAFARALGEVKSFSELLALQSEHARKGYEALAEQTRVFAGLAQKVATDSVGPLNATFGKATSLAA